MIKKILPAGFKVAVRNAVKKYYNFKEYEELYEEFELTDAAHRASIEAEIPKVDLSQKHIKNARILLNRQALLSELPKHAVCAEIGVNEGEFSAQILQLTAPQKLHLVDAWGDEKRYHDGLKLQVEEKFSYQIKQGIVEINKGFSTDVLKTFPDHYFDWVYLDTDHTYKPTADELYILKDKVKPGGMITGHDYIIGNWLGNCRYGVIEAVHELCLKDDWELVFITINKNEMPSFAIRKIP